MRPMKDLPEVAGRIIEAINKECEDLTHTERAMVLLFVNKMTGTLVHLDTLNTFEHLDMKDPG